MRSLFAFITLTTVLGLVSADVLKARQSLPPYKNLQVFQALPANELLATMDYFVAATGTGCGFCHQPGKPGEAPAMEIDGPRKIRAREMIRMVQAFNAANYGVTISCATCHAGHQRPIGIEMMTPERWAPIAAAVTAAAARSAPGTRAPTPAPNPVGEPADVPAPTVDAVLEQYFAAVGGRAAVNALPATLTSATMMNVGTPQKLDFVVDRHGAKFVTTISVPQAPQAQRLGFDGSSAWMTTGAAVTDAPARTYQRLELLSSPTLSPDVLKAYANLKAERPTTLRLTLSAAPTKVNVLVGSLWPGVLEHLYFDATTGLLVRRECTTRIALGGELVDWYDYGDYEAFAGVKVPRSITQTTSTLISTMTVIEIKAAEATDEARFSRPKGSGGR
jgi:hypothetical protein